MAVLTAVKVSIVGLRATKKGAKAYGAVKGAKVVGRPVVKVAAVPVTVAGGVVVWRKLKSSSSDDDRRAARSAPSRAPTRSRPPPTPRCQTAGSDS